MQIEKERRQREELESRLNALQSKVMGHAMLGGILGGAAGGDGGAGGEGGADDPEVILAKQQAAHRKAQLKLKREKKRQAKLKEAQKKALEAQRMAEEESKMTKEAMEARTKELKKTKHKYVVILTPHTHTRARSVHGITAAPSLCPPPSLTSSALLLLCVPVCACACACVCVPVCLCACVPVCLPVCACVQVRQQDRVAAAGAAGHEGRVRPPP